MKNLKCIITIAMLTMAGCGGESASVPTGGGTGTPTINGQSYQTYSSKEMVVIDGDTVAFNEKNSSGVLVEVYRCNLRGIDSPELYPLINPQPFALESKTILKSILAAAVSTSDRIGVYIYGKNEVGTEICAINNFDTPEYAQIQLVHNGLAWVTAKEPSQALALALKNGQGTGEHFWCPCGFWDPQLPPPISPADWRKINGIAED